MQRDRLPGGSHRSAEGLHILPFRLLQVRPLRHKANAEDVLQQPAQAR